MQTVLTLLVTVPNVPWSWLTYDHPTLRQPASWMVLATIIAQSRSVAASFSAGLFPAGGCWPDAAFCLGGC